MFAYKVPILCLLGFLFGFTSGWTRIAVGVIIGAYLMLGMWVAYARAVEDAQNRHIRELVTGIRE
jgi:hypothetical protein